MLPPPGRPSARNYTEYGDVRVPPRPDGDNDDESPHTPPSDDNLSDQFPIAERG